MIKLSPVFTTSPDGEEYKEAVYRLLDVDNKGGEHPIGYVISTPYNIVISAWDDYFYRVPSDVIEDLTKFVKHILGDPSEIPDDGGEVAAHGPEGTAPNVTIRELKEACERVVDQINNGVITYDQAFNRTVDEVFRAREVG